jgi:hypothetical protein
MSGELVVTQTSEVAARFKESGLFPDLKSESQAFVKILAGQELGIGPMAAVAGLNVIQGKVTLSANLLATMVKRHPAYDYRVTDHTEKGCRIVFFQDGEQIGESVFTLEDAQRAGLRGQNWTKYPKAMLFARALTQGVRWFCPDVTAGSPAYDPDELEQAETVETVDAVIAAPVKPVKDLDYLGTLVDDYEFDQDQRVALRDFVKAGGDNAIQTAILLLEEGNPSALFAGMEYEAA